MADQLIPLIKKSSIYNFLVSKVKEKHIALDILTRYLTCDDFDPFPKFIWDSKCFCLFGNSNEIKELRINFVYFQKKSIQKECSFIISFPDCIMNNFMESMAEIKNDLTYKGGYILDMMRIERLEPHELNLFFEGDMYKRLFFDEFFHIIQRVGLGMKVSFHYPVRFLLKR